MYRVPSKQSARTPQSIFMIMSIGASIGYALAVVITYAPFIGDDMASNGVLSFFARGTNTIFFLLLHALVVALFGLVLILGVLPRIGARKRRWMVIVFWLVVASLMLFHRAVATMTDDIDVVFFRRSTYPSASAMEAPVDEQTLVRSGTLTS
jgi:hypothetical protein